ncbi:MAG: NAD(P)-dependent oxidoreductase [Myxococcota bacterium]
MKTVAFLGLGAMGRRMARRVIDAGYDVRLWSRSGVPDGLEGGQQAGSAREAAEGADLVISIVRDDDASRAVWSDPDTGALRALAKDAVAVESSTLTPARVLELHGEAAELGVALLDGPVVGPRPQAEAGALVFLLGGSSAPLERVRPVLESMGSAVRLLGPAGSGAKAKLVVNALLGVQVAFLAEALPMVERSGLDVRQTFEMLTSLPVTSPAAKLLGGFMLDERFAPLFPIELVAKDFAYAKAAAKAAGASVPLIEAAADVFERADAEGLGDQNLTAAIKLYA